MPHPDYTQLVVDAKATEAAAGNRFANNCDILRITDRVLLALHERGELVSHFPKPSGDGVCNGFSISRIVFSDLDYYKILSNAGPGGDNGPQWALQEGKANADQYLDGEVTGNLPPGPVDHPPITGPTDEQYHKDLELRVTDLQNSNNDMVKRLDALKVQADANRDAVLTHIDEKVNSGLSQLTALVGGAGGIGAIIDIFRNRGTAPPAKAVKPTGKKKR